MWWKKPYFGGAEKPGTEKGTLAVLGNHDHYSGHTDREKEILEGLSIRVLLNEGFLTGEGIMVNGMGDFLYHPLSEVPPSDGHFPSSWNMNRCP